MSGVGQDSVKIYGSLEEKAEYGLILCGRKADLKEFSEHVKYFANQQGLYIKYQTVSHKKLRVGPAE